MRYSQSILMVLVCLAATPFSRAQKTPPPVPDDIELVADVEYGKGGERVLKLDILRPKKVHGEPMPVVVFVHGGSWAFGTKEGDRPKLYSYAQRGYFCASIQYRLSHVAIFPAQIEDCKCAIRFLRSRAKEYNLDPNRIGVWGISAGGHLCALLGTTAHLKELEGKGGSAEFSSEVQAVCDFCGPTDFLKWGDKAIPQAAKLLGGPIQDKKELAILASPITHITKKVPPFLIVHGDLDNVVPIDQAVTLKEALKNVGGDVTLHRIENGGHGFGGPAIDKLVREFFDRHLKDSKSKTDSSDKK